MSNIGGIDKLKIEVEFPNKRNNINILLDSIKSFGEIKKVSDLFDSNIQFDEYFVESWLNHRKFKTELLYRKSRDGSKPDDFHNKCDNQGITITFIETTKGCIFWGYTELPWDKSEKYKNDKSAFLFSINKKKKYIARNDSLSIYCGANEGPRFGCGYPEIYLHPTLDKGKSYKGDFCTFIG